MSALHIIEPTLNNTSGHCITLVRALAKAATGHYPGMPVHVWAGRHLPPQALETEAVTIHRHFRRRIRRLQLWGLMRRLADGEHRILLPTAGRSEIAIHCALPKNVRQRLHAWFFVHHLKMDERRARKLRLLSRRAPETRILCTHPELVTHFHAAGFTQARLQPCPFEPPAMPFSARPFQRLIFPGEAREDKNLAFIPAIIEELARRKADIPVMIQAGPNHHGEFPDAVRAHLQRIADTGYPHLEMPRQAWPSGQYLAQFSGGICLQPYRVDDYAKKISGITLDALTRGCPCIATPGTWPASVVNEFGAGLAVELDAKAWVDAIEHLVEDYSRYQQGCARAVSTLTERHHPLRTLETILGDDQ